MSWSDASHLNVGTGGKSFYWAPIHCSAKYEANYLQPRIDCHLPLHIFLIRDPIDHSQEELIFELVMID